ncbi:MAG: phage tail tape measure protein [Alphaproteobacteria bacterium]|nr:MAG: phage tail tape measure protein [Alphaproteobacteria bacterium]
MRRNEKNLGVRLGISGGRKFKADMQGIGKAGQNSMRKIENSARAATPELLIMNKAAGGLNRILRQGAGLAAAYVSINSLFSSVSGFAAFEQGLVGVGKTTNIVGAELKFLGDDVDALSRRIPVAAASLLGIAQSAGQLGVKGVQNILLFTETMAKMESATDLVGAEGSKSLVRILNVTGEATDNIDNLSSAVVALGNNMAATESEIVNQAREIAAAGTAYDITSAQAAGLGGAFAAMGIQAELSGSTITRSFLAMDDAIAKGGEKLRLLSELTGIAGDDLEQAFGDNAVAVFEKFLIGLNRVDQSGGRISETLAKFGLSSVRTLKTLPVMAKRVDDVSEALALSSKEFVKNTALNKEAAAAYDTLGSEGKILSNTMSSLSRGFAEGFSDELKTSTKEVRALTEAAIPASKELGESFAPAVVFASKALVTLVENGEIVIKVLGGLLIARSAAAGFRLLSTALLGNAGAIIGLRAMIAVSPIAAAQMVATAGAAKLLSGALALVGGPAGLAVLVAGGLALLATRQTEAEKAAEDHRKFLKELNDELDRETKTLKELNLEKDKSISLRRQDAAATLAELRAKREDLKFLDGPLPELSIGGRIEEKIKKQEKLLLEFEDLEARRRFAKLDNAAPFSIFESFSEKRNSANDNISPVSVQSFPNLSARDAAALSALTEAGELQNVKVLSQTVEQYDKARASIAATLAGMEIDALRATGNVTEAIRAEADAQIAIWRQRAKDGVATDKEMFQAKKLINEQATRDIEQARQDVDAGFQAGKSAAATFTETLVAAGATSGSILQQLGRSFRTTMLKMVSDALLLKPIQSIFTSIFQVLPAFFPDHSVRGAAAVVAEPSPIYPIPRLRRPWVMHFQRVILFPLRAVVYLRPRIYSR